MVDIFYCLLIADFISGLGHWIEDVYGDPNWKYGSSIVLANIEHHSTPRSFLTRSYWHRNKSLIIFFYVFVMVSLAFNFFSWQLALLSFLLSQVNEIHAFAHRKKNEIPTFIFCLQEIGVLQSLRHHSFHHKAPYDSRMCIITNFLNPILDMFGFWRYLERALKYVKINPINERHYES